MFSSRLKKLRKENNYTLEDLSQIYNQRYNGRLSKGTLSKYENGNQEPMINVVKNFANLFEVSADYMLGITDDENYEIDSSKAEKAFDLLYQKYNRLNNNGQIKAESYIDGLLENPDYVKKEKVKTTGNTEGLVIDGILNDTELNMVANIGVSEPPKVKKKRKHT